MRRHDGWQSYAVSRLARAPEFETPRSKYPLLANSARSGAPISVFASPHPHYFAITPQAMRSPEFPDGSVL